MSRDFLKDIPEQFRHIYDKAAEPHPMRTHFETLKQQEDLKNKIRQSSALYKEIFQESMFGFVTINGELNLDIKVFIPHDLHRRLFIEKPICNMRCALLNELGSAFTTVELTDKQTQQTRELKIFYYPAPLTAELAQITTGVDEALIYIKSNYTDDHNDGVSNNTFYLNREARQDIQGMEKMLGSLFQVNSPTNNSSDINKRQYFMNALKAKPLRLSMARINWKDAYRSL